MAARAVFAVCAMSYHHTTERITEYMTDHMSENAPEPSAIELREFVLSVLYRLSTYAVINLIDDAAMLSIVFI